MSLGFGVSVEGHIGRAAHDVSRNQNPKECGLHVGRKPGVLVLTEAAA